MPSGPSNLRVDWAHGNETGCGAALLRRQSRLFNASLRKDKSYGGGKQESDEGLL